MSGGAIRRVASPSPATLHGHVEDLLHNSGAIRICGTCTQEIRRLEIESIPLAFEGYHHSMGCVRNFQMLLVPILVVFFGVVLQRTMQLIQDGRLTQAEFVSVSFVLMHVLTAVGWLSSSLSELVIDMGHVRNAAALFGEADPVYESSVPVGRPPDAARFAIGLRTVTFRYRADSSAVLDGVSLDFERGQCTALLGGVGEGKSTVVRLMLGLCAPTGGHLYLNGRWYGEWGLRAVRRRIAMVPQTVTLFAVGEMVVVSDTHTDDQSAHALQCLGVVCTGCSRW